MPTDSFTYTVRDNYSEATATVTVNIEAGSFVDARPDSADTVKGVAAEIDVIANDLASADNLPLVVQPGSITAPVPSGTATLQANGKILYTPVSGFTGDVSFNYTTKPSSKALPTSTAIVTVRVLDALSGFPKVPPSVAAAKQRWIGGGGPPGSTTYADSQAGLDAAIAAANPGDHIVFPNGTYRYSIDTAKSGSASGGYIVFRPANHLGATLAGTNAADVLDRVPKSWKFTGSYIWVTGFISENPAQHSPDPNKNYYFNSDRPETAFRLHGNNMRLTNCLIKSPQGVGIPDDVHHIDVCYNTFANQISPVWNQNNSIYIGGIDTLSNGPDNITIARNRWMNDAAVTHTAQDDMETRFCIYVGNSHLTSDTANVGVNRTVRIWENHVDVDRIGRGFYLKRTYDVRRNYIAVNIASGNQQGFQFRHGGYSKPNGEVFPGLSDSTRGWVEGNNFANGRVFINDTDHLWLGNRFAKIVELRYGGRRWQKNSASTGWEPSPAEGWIQAASRNWFIGCQFGGNMELGTDEGDDKKPYKLDPGQGGVITGVKIYRGTQAAPTLVRLKDWQNGATTTPPRPAGAGVDAVAAGDAGCQILTGTNDYTVPAWVTGPDLIASGVGCDPA